MSAKLTGALGLSLSAAVLAAALAIGCNKGSEPAPAKPSHEGHEHHDHDAFAAPANETNSDAVAGDIAKAMAALSAEDRAAAEKQKVCPVSGEPLGSMGLPYKVHMKGRDVFLCCPGCEEALRKDPDTYLAKIKR